MDNTRQPYILQNGIGAIPPGTPRCRQPKRKSPFIRHQTLSESDCREVCRSHRTLENKQTSNGGRDEKVRPEPRNIQGVPVWTQAGTRCLTRYDATCERQAGIGPVRGEIWRSGAPVCNHDRTAEIHRSEVRPAIQQRRRLCTPQPSRWASIKGMPRSCCASANLRSITN